MQVVIPAWYSGDMTQEVMHTALSESSQLVPAFGDGVDGSGTCQLHLSKGTCKPSRTVLMSPDHNSRFG